jgi:hypothetical protein
MYFLGGQVTECDYSSKLTRFNLVTRAIDDVSSLSFDASNLQTFTIPSYPNEFFFFHYADVKAYNSLEDTYRQVGTVELYPRGHQSGCYSNGIVYVQSTDGAASRTVATLDL